MGDQFWTGDQRVKHPNGRPSYLDLIERRIEKFGIHTDLSHVAKKFIPYYDSYQYIKVKIGELYYTGYVGLTTGPMPVFILIRNSNHNGSTTILTHNTEIVGRRYGKHYKPYKDNEMEIT